MEVLMRRRHFHRRSNYLFPRFESAIASGMVEGAYGNTVEAERQLDMVITETRRLGFSGYELEARLKRGFVELNPVKGGLGRLTSKSLRKDPAARGYRLIARKAHVPLV